MARALLSVRLLAAAGDLRTGPGFLCALSVISELLDNSKVYKMFVHIHAEHSIGKIDGADFLTFHIVN
jgi:hypothetical protein